MPLYPAFILIFAFLSGVDVVTIGNRVFSDTDFHSKYSKQEWNRVSVDQKKKMIDDFAKREACALEARSLGFMNDPNIAIKLRDRSQMSLVNSVYEELVARPLLSEETLTLSRKHLRKEVDVSHLLVGFSGCALRSAPKRSKDEAFLLAQRLYGDLQAGRPFRELAEKHSDDPSAIKNGGHLGWLSWGRTVSAFQKAAFNLPDSALSGPVLTKFGYHLIFAGGTRPSEFSLLQGEAFEEAVYAVSKGSVSALLRPAAAAFDSSNLINAGIHYNDRALLGVFNGIAKEAARKKIVGQHKVDLVSLFNDLENVGVVCVYGGKGFGIKWFANRLESVPPSRHPSVGSVDDLRSSFNMILLQYIAVKMGVEAGVDRGHLYTKQVHAIENSLLYDAYLKWLVNSSPKPDSLLVRKYYDDNKDEKYLDPEMVRVREIRVDSFELSEQLWERVDGGADFEFLAQQHSRTNPSGGGLVAPFPRGKYNDMGAVAFALDVGGVSSVIENLDKTFSIIRLEERIPKQHSRFKSVYSRIESLLLRDLQNKSKSDGVDGLFEKFNIVVNSDFIKDSKNDEN